MSVRSYHATPIPNVANSEYTHAINVKTVSRTSPAVIGRIEENGAVRRVSRRHKLVDLVADEHVQVRQPSAARSPRKMVQGWIIPCERVGK